MNVKNNLFSKVCLTVFKKRLQLIQFLLILSGAIAIRIYNINNPLVGFFDGPLFSSIARNYLRYGFLETKFGPVEQVINGNFIYYANHPPFLGLIISVNFLLFGEHAWSARLVPILFSIGSIVLLYLIARQVWDNKIAMLSAFFMSFMPISVYFGKITNHEPLVLFFVLLAVYSYLNLSNRMFVPLMFAAFILGVLTDYPALYIAPLLLAYSLIQKDRMRTVFSLLLNLAGLLVFALFLLYTKYLIGDIGILWKQGLLRSGQQNGFLTSPDFYSTIFNHIYLMYGPITVLSTVIATGWFVYLIVKRRFEDPPHRGAFVLMWYAFGLIHIVLFNQGAYFHDFWVFYLIPAFSLTLALVTARSGKINKFILLVLGACFLILSVNTLVYLESFRSLDSDQPVIGEYIRENSVANDTILIYGGTFLPYYADRASLFLSNYNQSSLENLLSAEPPRFVVYHDNEPGLPIGQQTLEGLLMEHGYKLQFRDDHNMLVWKL